MAIVAKDYFGRSVPIIKGAYLRRKYANPAGFLKIVSTAALSVPLRVHISIENGYNPAGFLEILSADAVTIQQVTAAGA